MSASSQIPGSFALGAASDMVTIGADPSVVIAALLAEVLA